MTQSLLSLTFRNADILRPGGLACGDISMADGTLCDTPHRSVDATGYLILPGIIDLHGDGFEHHMAPRRGAQTDPALGLRAVEAELAANGITTAMLAQFYSWEGGMRSPEFASRIAEALHRTDALTDLRLQLRVETHLLDHFDDVRALVERYGIGYLVWNDHLPHKALDAGKRPPRLTGQALKSGRSPDAHLAYLQALHARHHDVPHAVAEFSRVLLNLGVLLGSHDDTTPQDRDRFRAMGVRIAEFPETHAAALAAHTAGDPVIMGAPNVVRGGSHDKKVSARALIEEGVVNALVSDYHYPSLHRAALKLWDAGMTLCEAWGLISSGPADVMGWTDRGRLALGARADLVMMNAQSRRIEGVFCAGRVIHLTGDLAARMIK